MTPFEVFKQFLALKLYFTKDYDYFKYNKTTSASKQSFENRRDKYQYHKLANHQNFEGLMLSNYLAGEKISWAGDLLLPHSQENYEKWLGYNESLTYNFKKELNLLGDDLTLFKESFIIKNGRTPILLKKVLKKEISYETLIILNDVLHFFDLYNDKMADAIIWPEIYIKCSKYKPFFEADISKFRKIIKDKYMCQ